MIKDIFYLPQYRAAAFLAYITYVIVFAKFYEKFLEKTIRSKFKFLDDRNKEIAFGVFVTGFISLSLLLLIKIIGFRIHYFWWAMGFLTTFGGALGLVPFSFFGKESNQNEGLFPNKAISKSMGIGALLSSLVAFLVGFLFVFRTSPKDITIAIIMGLVFSIPGILLGIFLGMVVGYIIKKVR